MKRLLIAAALALTLAGCAGTKVGDFIQTVEQAATGSVSPEAVYIAANAFDAAEVSATNYLNLKKCPQNAPFCRDPKVTSQLVPAIRSGRVARNNLLQFLKDHPNSLGPSGLYDALTSATATIQSILKQYNVGG